MRITCCGASLKLSVFFLILAPGTSVAAAQAKLANMVVAAKASSARIASMVHALRTAMGHPASAHVQPCFLFVGEAFEASERHRLLRSHLLDLFRGHAVHELPLMSVSRIFVCVASGEAAVWLYHYAILLKKSGTKVRARGCQLSCRLLNVQLQA